MTDNSFNTETPPQCTSLKIVIEVSCTFHVLVSFREVWITGRNCNERCWYTDAVAAELWMWSLCNPINNIVVCRFSCLHAQQVNLRWQPWFVCASLRAALCCPDSMGWNLQESRWRSPAGWSTPLSSEPWTDTVSSHSLTSSLSLYLPSVLSVSSHLLTFSRLYSSCWACFPFLISP